MYAYNRILGAHKKWLVALTIALATTFGAMSGARAQDQGAAKILKAMSDYVTSQKTISLKFDSSIEVITPELQKIQFDSSGSVELSRPDKIRATRTGGYADVEFIFDGKTFTVFDKAHNQYAQSQSSGSIDQLVNKLRTEYLVEAPGADLLVSDVYKQMMAGVLDAKHIGRAVIDGVECDHLAFRDHDTDWQIWVQVGDKPIPRKYVITSKTVAGAPQYTLVVRDWKTDVSPRADAFAFKAPDGAKKVAFKDLADVDAVPPGMIQAHGEKQ
jgi:hypothetical protein